jgi:hypothetical protein
LSSQSCAPDPGDPATAPLPIEREERKERYRLSGLQRAELSPSGVDVSRIVCAPSQLVIQTSLSLRSRAVSAVPTV